MSTLETDVKRSAPKNDIKPLKSEAHVEKVNLDLNTPRI
jgi:hypothetical protein